MTVPTGALLSNLYLAALVTDEQIVDLRRWAIEHNDREMRSVCDAALGRLGYGPQVVRASRASCALHLGLDEVAPDLSIFGRNLATAGALASAYRRGWQESREQMKWWDL